MSFYAGPERGALALVESPAQLLNVIELARREDDLAGVKIAVLAPSASLTRNQLRSMVTLGREAGHSISWHEPRLGGMAVARSVRALAGRLSGVQRLIAGDPLLRSHPGDHRHHPAVRGHRRGRRHRNTGVRTSVGGWRTPLPLASAGNAQPAATDLQTRTGPNRRDGTPPVVS